MASVRKIDLTKTYKAKIIEARRAELRVLTDKELLERYFKTSNRPAGYNHTYLSRACLVDLVIWHEDRATSFGQGAGK